MVEPLDELARITGDFRVTPIPGFGSYQSGSTASGSTATGGGHIDLYLTKASASERLMAERLARMIGFYADIRMPKWYSRYFGRWLKASWAPHLHMLLKDDVHLSAGAKAQLREWYAGENGLAGGDLDDGPRDYLHQTWAGYKADRTPARPDPLPAKPAKTVTVKKGDTLAKIAAALGVSLAALVAVNPQIKDPALIQPGQTVTAPAVPGPSPTKAPAKPPVKVTPKPAPKPTTKPKPKPTPKPAPKPAPKPKPAVVKKPVTPKPAPKPTRVDASKLHKGVSSRHVTAYQKALRAYLGTKVANRYNPAGATGFYGPQTQALTKAAYRKLGATPWATEPGPGLLKVLRLR